MKDCFNINFNNIETEITVFTRPYQSLFMHFYNLICQIDKIIGNKQIYIPSIKSSNMIKLDTNLLHSYLEVIFASHDFGKLSPLFQDKIIRVMANNKNKIENSYNNECIVLVTNFRISQLFLITTINPLIKF
ncbi:MAG: HD domain-containing protein [Candidatus Heimdallarchaeota archaeon]|nr:HD domain-containing protein [Candidatus Heimdallarchaeota archaeon]MDH5644901.1 HD domain-containing protein [Candidatus Heimdallarchaeota archaeon]